MSRQRVLVHSAPELGCVVRKRRGELELSRERIASLTGVDPAVLAQLEQDDGTVELQVALLICTSSAWRSRPELSSRTHRAAASTRCSACVPPRAWP